MEKSDLWNVEKDGAEEILNHIEHFKLFRQADKNLLKSTLTPLDSLDGIVINSSRILHSSLGYYQSFPFYLL